MRLINHSMIGEPDRFLPPAYRFDKVVELMRKQQTKSVLNTFLKAVFIFVVVLVVLSLNAVLSFLSQFLHSTCCSRCLGRTKLIISTS